MSGNFGFTSDNSGKDESEDGNNSNANGKPNFGALFKQFANFGINPQTLFASGTGNDPLISTDTIRDVARKFLSAQNSTSQNGEYVSIAESEQIKEAFNIANLWLDEKTFFPALTQTAQPAWSRRDWLDSSLKGWQKLVEPLAEGMASALTNVLKDSSVQFGGEFGIGEGVETTPEMLQGISILLRSFMGSMIATQLGQSIGLLATSVTGSHDVAIPLYEHIDTHLIPQNIKSWGEGLDIPESEVRIFLALREAAAARLFTHTPWLTQYVQAAFAAYGKGIKVDLLSIQEQAETAVNQGDLDINNPDSITSAISKGLFTPEQSPEQDAALAKLEMILALIDGWIDHLVTVSATDRIPSLAALSESIRRRRASNSPTQQLFATLLGLEVSPRKTRECATFWAKVLELRGYEDRDCRWEDPSLLPTASDVNDAEKFLQSTTVPDDLSGLI
jgi:putative hydrolase